MNVLEKILEEIERTRKSIIDMSDEEPELVDVEDWFDDGVDQGKLIAYEVAKEIIRSHMDDISREKDTKITRSSRDNDGWIPIEERLPEEHNSMFAKFKGTDMWKNAMFEKKSDEVNVTIELEDGTRKTTTSCTLDGQWKVEKEQQVVKTKVIAWQHLPEPYRPEGKE